MIEVNIQQMMEVNLIKHTKTSSLALHPFRFDLGFPHERYPFCSAHGSCPPSFYTHFPQVQFDIIVGIATRYELDGPGIESR
jgi:hypothetical protein